MKQCNIPLCCIPPSSLSTSSECCPPLIRFTACARPDTQPRLVAPQAGAGGPKATSMVLSHEVDRHAHPLFPFSPSVITEHLPSATAIRLSSFTIIQFIFAAASHHPCVPLEPFVMAPLNPEPPHHRFPMWQPAITAAFTSSWPAHRGFVFYLFSLCSGSALVCSCSLVQRFSL